MSEKLDADVSLRFEIVRIIRERTGMNERYAVPLADDIVTGLVCLNGGLYIPKREKRAERDEAVRRDFNGRNHREVMARHHISRRTLYRIIGERD